MLDNFYAVIMAGGGGTRLWPLSRQKNPKQMLTLVEDRSLFQIAVDRVRDIFTPERVFVVTVEDQADELRKQCPDIPGENYLLEPLPRGTASVVGLASVALSHRNPQAVMAVLTADHFIANEESFKKILTAAYDTAQDGHLVTLGITPTHPAINYGYIQTGEPLGRYQGLEVFNVLRFKEKPDADLAKQMVETGNHSWNSGMFVWRVDCIMDEINRQMPDLADGLQEISIVYDTSEERGLVKKIWSNLVPETIDYGIMEGADKVAVIPVSDLGWSDVGSWDSIYDVLPTDENGNIVMNGQHIALSTQSTLINSNVEKRTIVTIGVEDLVIVDTEDILLVCKKDQSQEVRQVVKMLKKTGSDLV